MADFLDSEAEESDQSEDDELEPHERKKLKRLKAVSDSEEEDEEDDEERIREELKDLIDDNPIEEDESGDESDGSGGSKKRKKSDDDDELDDRLEDEDYDLIEENLGVKVERRKRFKRLKRFQDEESDNEKDDEGLNREVLAERLFVGSDDEEERQSERSLRVEPTTENYDDEEEEESDADDFIVDDDGRPIAEKRKKRRPIFTDASLQEGQDIFGVDFDYDDFDNVNDYYESESEAEDEYEAEAGDGEREKRPKAATKRKTMKKSIFEIYEPSELKRGHFTDLDNEIRKVDIPERMQLRDVPITPVAENSNELDEEAEWIYKQAFVKSSISNQDPTFGDDRSSVRERKKPSTAIPKIKQAVDFIRNNHFEVPFIAFYRKEYVQPELNINDLWKVYRYDAKWCQLQSRKNSLVKLFEKMRNYQIDKIMANPDAPLPDELRVMKEEDIERLKRVQTLEELKDVHAHFLLYYAHEIPDMQEAWMIKERDRIKQSKRDARRKQREEREENGEQLDDIEEIDDDEVDDDELPQEETLKHTYDSGPYAMCRKAKICSFAKKFGLTPEQFAENLRDNYQRHDVEQEEQDPFEVAQNYITPKFQTAEEVLHAAKFVVARQIAREPMLRKAVREILYERGKISVVPTKKGVKEIDENNSCYSMKYLKDKPVRDLVGDQFLKLLIAERDDLLSITITDKIEGSTCSSYLEEVKALYQRDEFSKTVGEWNDLRGECVELAINKMVLPDLRKELKIHLEIEAKEAILRSCCKKLCNWLKVAPYNADIDEEEYAWSTKNGIRVMGLAYVPDLSQAAFCSLVGTDGDVTDYLRLCHILKRKNSHRPEEKLVKETDIETVKDFIRDKKPHVIGIGGESREALMIQQDLREVIKELVEEENFPQISVEIVDNELAKIYANSKKGTSDFREYPTLLKQAISIARKLQDPLVEYSQLCTADEEILCLRYHTLQDYITKEELLEGLYIEFINRTNEVGVDINLAVQNSLTVNLVQFISGLGPRKGQALIKILKQTNQRLENRTQLVTACHMGPKVFINCSGFIKIDTNSLGDSTEAYVEVLDGSRVHPETYEWARKMAVDALEYDDEDANPAGALEEILEAPERLKDLDLDAFAVELERQGFGNKSITLYDIRAELNSRYRDLRMAYRSPTSEELFDMLTKEAPETFYVGKMIMATVFGYSHKKPQGEQLDQANPVRNDETGLWQCPFCMKNDFPELSEVWNHFDAKECPGQAIGIKLRLDNGLMAFIHIKNLSDKHVKNPEERVQIGQTIHCRVTKIQVEKFSVDCTSKSSDLLDRNHEWRPHKDPYYDQDREEQDLRKEEDSKKTKQRQQYIKRVIVHPAFHNKSYFEVIKIMASMDQGEVIMRPSSKGVDHLTVTWKVTDDIYQHIDVREEGKENSFSLGQSLWIGNEEFEDLDEIIARHVNPMASYARDLLNYKYYRDTGGMKDKAEEILKEDKRKQPNKIHYVVAAAKNYPGKFLLSYLPRTRCRHEYVTVTPDGFRFRQQVFDSLPSLLKWFKEHFRDPLPGNTPVSTPRGSASMSSRTPYGVTPGHGSVNSGMSSEVIQRVAQNIPSHMLHSLSQAASQTPHYPHTPGYGGQTSYINTPYTPSGQTPFMTPYHTPHSSTPRYGSGNTPVHGTSSSNGQFARPKAPFSGTRTSYQTGSHSHQSPYGRAGRHRSQSPHVPQASPHARAYASQETEDWDAPAPAPVRAYAPKETEDWDAPPTRTYPSKQTEDWDAPPARSFASKQTEDWDAPPARSFASKQTEDWDAPAPPARSFASMQTEDWDAPAPPARSFASKQTEDWDTPAPPARSFASKQTEDWDAPPARNFASKQTEDWDAPPARSFASKQTENWDAPQPRAYAPKEPISHASPHARAYASQEETEDWDAPPPPAPQPRAYASKEPISHASPHARAYASQETEDWDAADEAWASRSSSKSRDGSITPRDIHGTPRGAAQRTPRYDEHPRRTPQYDDGRPSSRASRDYNAGKSPRSVRSTPRTNTSPHSMMLGDSTPLYDEN